MVDGFEHARRCIARHHLAALVRAVAPRAVALASTPSPRKMTSCWDAGRRTSPRRCRSPALGDDKPSAFLHSLWDPASGVTFRVSCHSAVTGSRVRVTLGVWLLPSWRPRRGPRDEAHPWLPVGPRAPIWGGRRVTGGHERFPTRGTWRPGHDSLQERRAAGRSKGNGSTVHGDPYLSRVLGGRRSAPVQTTPSWASANRIARLRGVQ